MDELKEKLYELIEGLSSDLKKAIKDDLASLISVYPFSEYEYIISSLLSLEKITFDDYVEIRREYAARNKNLELYTISSPTGFGITWAQGYLNKIIPELEKPTKELDKEYKVTTDYDFFLSDKDRFIRIEVKASRAVDKNSKKSLPEKAIPFKSKTPFDMNFQQIKPKSCDVFVWIAVWKDVIKYWVLSSYEVESNEYYSGGQHRGNEGEGQLHLNETNMKAFGKYEVMSNKLKDAIVSAYKRQKRK